MKIDKKIITILFLIVITGVAVTFALPTIPSNTITVDVWAESGHHSDIQNAINSIAFTGGTVGIPEGTWNFVNIDETWTKVEVPAGVNIVGAITEKDSNGQVVNWKTVLTMPYDVPSGAVWFELEDNFNGLTTRISEIKLVGYRSIDSSSKTIHTAIKVLGSKDFRIDHCSFEHTTGGISIFGLYNNGVIDHCKLINYYAYDDLANYINSDVGYGVQIHREYSSTGVINYEPLTDVLGKYTDHTIIIEDCYFSKWRHCVSSNHGSHYVFRYNTIENDLGHYSLDAHGLRDEGVDKWGTRCVEIYENQLISCEGTFGGVYQAGGGSGVWFNNYVDGTYNYFTLHSESYIQSEDWHLKDFYVWSSKGITPMVTQPVGTIDFISRNIEVDWTREAGTLTDLNYPNVNPEWSISYYVPYQYPCPLVTETEYPTETNDEESGTLKIYSTYNETNIETEITITFENGTNLVKTTPTQITLPIGEYKILAQTEYGYKSVEIEIINDRVITINFEWADINSEPIINIQDSLFSQPYLILLIGSISVIVIIYKKINGDKKN